MSTTFFLRLRSIRASKVERAQRECLEKQELLARCEQALQSARQQHSALVAAKEHAIARWRAKRLALVAFEAQDLDGHEAALRRCDRRIAEAWHVVQERLAQRDTAAEALSAANQALARRRVELAKADNGVNQHRLLERCRDEAIEEDELDELAVIRPRQSLMELHA